MEELVNKLQKYKMLYDNYVNNYNISMEDI